MPSTRLRTWSYGATLALSAYLLFSVQPLLTRFVLPVLGGSPAVWNTVMVFFQTVLLGGYLYAHALTKWLPLGRQVAVHLALVLAAGLTLPLTIAQADASAARAPWSWLLSALSGSVLLPALVLSATAPLLQKWFSLSRGASERDPYALYAASNAGSLAALLAYPLLVERYTRLGAQASAWTLGYLVLALCVGACGALALRSGAPSHTNATREADTPRIPVTSSQRWHWLALASVPSGLMLAVTLHLSTDVASIPLIWVLPLAVYLLTFVVAFSRLGPAALSAAQLALPVTVFSLLALTAVGSRGALVLTFAWTLAGFAVITMCCHGLLAARRPDVSHLTEYYLLLALGGCLGGWAVSLAAPLIFSSVIEYPLLLGAGALLGATPAVPTARAHGLSPRDLALALVLVAAYFGLLLLGGLGALPAKFMVTGLAVASLFAVVAAERPRLGGLIALGFALAVAAPRPTQNHILLAERTFFGTYRVERRGNGRFHALAHGTTLHGKQLSAGRDRPMPLAYFHPEGPAGDLLRALRNQRPTLTMGVVGLGVGSLAGYRQEGDHWTFYEIDPVVERIARTPAYFTHLDDCREGCPVVIGDARVSLASRTGAEYDALVLDAFSSDSIPLHLLTREAFETYRSRLRPSGVLAYHISNRHLDLEPVLGALGQSVGWENRTRFWIVADDDPTKELKASAHWVVMAPPGHPVLASLDLAGWRATAMRPGIAVWTDDFSNLVSVIR